MALVVPDLTKVVVPNWYTLTDAPTTGAFEAHGSIILTQAEQQHFPPDSLH